MVGFYLVKSKSKSVLTYLSATGYDTQIVATKKVDNIINEYIEDSFQNNMKFLMAYYCQSNCS